MNPTLEKHLANDSLAISYLLVGDDSQTAKKLAAKFNPADVFQLSPREGEKSITVEQVKDFLNKTSLSAVGDRKLYIIADSSVMTSAAQNKLLKTIEDAVAGTTFLLVASDEDKVLNTIKSRCVTLYSHNPAPTMVSKKLVVAAEGLLAAKTLDQALPHIAVLGTKDNVPMSLVAINNHCKNTGRFDILGCMSDIKRRVGANCNPQNAFDLLVIEMFG